MFYSADVVVGRLLAPNWFGLQGHGFNFLGRCMESFMPISLAHRFIVSMPFVVLGLKLRLKFVLKSAYGSTLRSLPASSIWLIPPAPQHRVLVSLKEI